MFCCFQDVEKEPGLLLAAWHVLMEVAGDETLFPEKVKDWYEDIVAKYGDSEVQLTQVTEESPEDNVDCPDFKADWGNNTSSSEDSEDRESVSTNATSFSESVTEQ